MNGITFDYYTFDMKIKFVNLTLVILNIDGDIRCLVLFIYVFTFLLLPLFSDAAIFHSGDNKVVLK